VPWFSTRHGQNKEVSLDAQDYRHPWQDSSQVVSPNVGDSVGTLGRRTYSAGECSRTPSLTQVR
jgi:hypothetical protein